MMGGLLQLVAYGAQDVYINNNWSNPTGFNYKTKSKKIQFFYKKIKNKANKIKNKITSHVIYNNNEPESRYVYNNTTSLNNYKIELHKSEKYAIKRKKTIYKIIDTQKMSYIKKSLQENLKINNLMCKLTNNKNIVFKLIGNNRYNMINKLSRLHQMLFNKLVLNTYINKYNFSIEKILILSKFVPKLETTINKHYNIINTIDISENNKLKIKNTTCHITFNEINYKYISCGVCNECFDYDGTIDWFKSNPYCACCRSYINIKQNTFIANNIYNTLKTL